MANVVALGELLIDFTPYGKSDKSNDLYECNPGGAPCNVLASVSKLGLSSSFIGMVGNDNFGHHLKNTLKKFNINSEGLIFSNKYRTTLAFVHLDNKGERSFTFFRNPGADMMLTPEDVPLNIVKSANIFHFGGLSMTNESSKNAALLAAKTAKENGQLVSYDPNYRPLLWNSIKEAAKKMYDGLKYTDILKVSHEEMEMFTGTNDLLNGSNVLYDIGIKLVLVTLAEKGCFYFYKNGYGQLPTFAVNVVDTTASGDSFLGGVLYKIIKLNNFNISSIKNEEMKKIIEFANAMGALTATKKGAIDSIPSFKEVTNCINHFSKNIL